MSNYLINSEDSEDTFDSSDNLLNAIRIARDVIRRIPSGEVVVVEHAGKVLVSLVQLPSTEIIEQSPT